MTALRAHSRPAKIVPSPPWNAGRSSLPTKARVPAAVTGAPARGLAAGNRRRKSVVAVGKLLGIRLSRHRPLGDHCTKAARGAFGTAIEGGRVLQRLTAIECELHEIRASARIAQRRSPVEFLLDPLTRGPGEFQ